MNTNSNQQAYIPVTSQNTSFSTSGHQVTFSLTSLGCAKNLVNSEQMLYLLQQEGFVLVPEPDGADFAVINTCGFIDAAKSEAIDTILEHAELKKAGERT